MELSTNQKLELKEIKKLLEEEYPEFQMDIKNGPFFEFLIIKKTMTTGSFFQLNFFHKLHLLLLEVYYLYWCDCSASTNFGNDFR